MISSVQRGLTLGVLGLVLLCAALAGHFDRNDLALASVLLPLVVFGGVLAVEFLAVFWINRHDPAPVASISQLIKAWWREIWSAVRVFCWRQPFRCLVWPDLVEKPQSATRGVIFIHGFACNRGIWNGWLARLTNLGVPFIAVNLEPVLGSIDDYVPLVEDAVRRITQATNSPPIVVAHSMGGLALRRWWGQPGNDQRVEHAITLGTPHHGTWLARFALSTNARQMRRHGSWIRSLDADEPVGRRSRITCYYSHCDNIVFPASTATLSGADNRHLEAVAHVQMVDEPEPFEELLRRLRHDIEKVAR